MPSFLTGAIFVRIIDQLKMKNILVPKTIRKLIIHLLSIFFLRIHINKKLIKLLDSSEHITTLLTRLRLTVSFELANNNQVSNSLKIAQQITIATSKIDVLYLLSSLYNLTGNHSTAEQLLEKIEERRTQICLTHQYNFLNLRVFGDTFAAIGHTALIEIFIKAQILGMIELKHNLICIDPRTVANFAWLRYWEAYCSVITSPETINNLKSILGFFDERLSVIKLTDGRVLPLCEFGREVQLIWEQTDRPSLLKPWGNHLAEGYQYMQAQGMPKDAWFCGLHVRDTKDSMRDVRNADIDTYGLAIQEIGRRGGWVVRIGDAKMRPLSVKYPNLIDYALSDHKEDWFDIFILSEGRFLLGTGSGPAAIPISFGKPVIYSNWGPLRHRQWGKLDILLPKHYWNRSEGRYLNLTERMSSKYGYMESTAALSKLDIDVIDNTPEELADVVKELLVINKQPQDNTNLKHHQHFYSELCKESGVYPTTLSTTFIKNNSSFFQ